MNPILNVSSALKTVIPDRLLTGEAVQANPSAWAILRVDPSIIMEDPMSADATNIRRELISLLVTVDRVLQPFPSFPSSSLPSWKLKSKFSCALFTKESEWKRKLESSSWPFKSWAANVQALRLLPDPSNKLGSSWRLDIICDCKDMLWKAEAVEPTTLRKNGTNFCILIWVRV